MTSDRAQFIIGELYKLGVTDFSLEIYLPPYVTEEEVQTIHQKLAECGMMMANEEDGGIFEIKEQ